MIDTPTTATHPTTTPVEGKTSYESFKDHGSHDLDALAEKEKAKAAANSSSNPAVADFSLNDQMKQLSFLSADDNINLAQDCNSIPKSFGLCGASQSIASISELLCNPLEDAERDTSETRGIDDSDEGRDDVYKVKVYKDNVGADDDEDKIEFYWSKFKRSAEDRAIAALERVEKAGLLSEKSMEQVRAKVAARQAARLEQDKLKAQAKAEAKAKAEMEYAIAKAEADAKAMAEAEEKAREQAEIRAKAEEKAAAKIKAAEKAKKKANAKAKAALKAAAKAAEEAKAAQAAQEKLFEKSEALIQAEAKVMEMEGKTVAVRVDSKKSSEEQNQVSIEDLVNAELRKSVSKESAGSSYKIGRVPSGAESLGDVTRLNEKAKRLIAGRGKDEDSIDDDLKKLNAEAADLVKGMWKRQEEDKDKATV